MINLTLHNFKLLINLIIITTLSLSCSSKKAVELDLSGNWSFQIDSLDKGIEQNWFAQNLSDTITLPGSMPQQHKGDRVNSNTKFTGNTWKEYKDGKTWLDDDNYKPYLSDDQFRYPFWLISDFHYVGAAWYQKEINIPEDWDGKTVELYLERCHWETKVWVNNSYIGVQNALGVPHRYDIAANLKRGRNRITICVDNRVKDINVGADAHSVSDNTQSNWNGIVGDIKLIQKSAISISNVQIFPDLEKKMVTVEIHIKNNTNTTQKGDINVSAKDLRSASSTEISDIRTTFECDNNSSIVTLDYPMGDDPKLWDEFNPNLYQLSVELEADKNSDLWEGNFGMRDLHSEGRKFVINGRPLFLRGTLECAIFPKTGFPPTDIEAWERIIKICKAHGLNHIRFHSWCPPKAAFDAADKLGFYYQVEASAWTAVGDNLPIDQWIYDECDRMVAEYGNHPSFCMMPYGNEPSGKNHKAYLIDFVKHWKAKDNRRVYTTAAGWPIVDENDFHNAYHGLRIQGWNQNLNSVINREAPRSDYDWSKAMKGLKSPMVSHEIGQWCVYPNFKEIPKYNGVLKATNFEIFKESLEAHGMLPLADDFLKASGKLQALCYKADIEAALRTEGFGGFQLLDLHDFPGQGTALIGILDPFWDEKGYISPEEFRQFCDETVPLARFKKMVFTSDQPIECEIEVAHYGEKEIASITPSWKIVDENGKEVKKGLLPKTNLAWGNCQKLGAISENFNVTKASKYQLQVDVVGFVNSWDFWVYPAKLPEVKEDILVVSSLTEEALSLLEKGGKVLLTVEKGTIKESKGGEVAVGFSSIFWNTAWTNGQKPHTLGILCDPAHPALSEFPTEYHSNWQWWDAMSHSNAISLESLSSKPEPIVRIIDDWVTNRNLALLFEAKVANGKLIVTGVDLQTNLEERPEARQLLYSLKNYMSKDEFNPKIAVLASEIEDLFIK